MIDTTHKCDVQRFRQSGYDNSLQPSESSDAHYMFYKDHAVVVSLLREQLTKVESQIQVEQENSQRLMTAILALTDTINKQRTFT